MRLTLTRSGGFAGLLPPPVTIDTATLPRAVAEQIEGLVASADFFSLPHAVTAPIRQPDRLQFTLHIVNEDGQEHTVTGDEEAAAGPFFELVRSVQNAARI